MADTYTIYVLGASDFTNLPTESGNNADPGGIGTATGSAPFDITVTGNNWIEVEVTDTQNGFFNELGGNGNAIGSQVLANDVEIDGTIYLAGTPIFTAYDLTGGPDGLQITTFHIDNNSGLGTTGPVVGAIAYGPMPPGTYTFTGESSSLASDNLYTSIFCFCKGTQIQTENGEKAIESLSAGDKVVTHENGVQTIRWIGSTKVAGHGNFAPIRISEGAFGKAEDGTPVPHRDLFVSPQHRMLISDWRAELMFGETSVLAAAKHLVNDQTIRAVETEEVEYFHILFDNHEVVIAEGAPSESFHPGQQGMGVLPEETREEIFTLFPELKSDVATYTDLAFPELRSFEGRALS